jgi:hypothetical protein
MPWLPSNHTRNIWTLGLPALMTSAQDVRLKLVVACGGVLASSLHGGFLASLVVASLHLEAMVDSLWWLPCIVSIRAPLQSQLLKVPTRSDSCPPLVVLHASTPGPGLLTGQRRDRSRDFDPGSPTRVRDRSRDRAMPCHAPPLDSPQERRIMIRLLFYLS